MNKKIKGTLICIFVTMTLVVAVCVSSMIVFADDFCKITIEYLYADGQPAYEPYVAVFRSGDDVDITVNNPEVLGYTPKKSLAEDAADEPVTELKYNNISSDYTIKVYYQPIEVSYKVRYFLQNISDDLYTEDNSLDEGLYNATGLTGSKPDDFEKFEGFTQLFHNEDKIAADGSTVFEVYYDRNYNLINFDLDGGYGVEPVYAKYGSIYTIAEPAKSGYVFSGWARTNEDGEYINEDGEIIDKTEAEGKCEKFSTGTIPANDEYYKAVWEALDTDYTVVYNVQNADDNGYSYAYSVKNTAPSGTLVSGKDDWSDEKFTESLGDMTSDIEKDFLVFNEEKTENKAVEGDGSTIINVYYDRKEYDIKFYYAWKKNDNYYISIETQNYYKGGAPEDLKRLYNMLDVDQVMVEKLPQVKDEYKYDTGYDLYSPDSRPKGEFYYIKFKARYGQNIRDLWPLEQLEPCIATSNSGSSANPVHVGDILFFSTWACPKDSYWVWHDDQDVGGANKNIATLYERLDKRIFANDPAVRKEQTGVNLAAYWSVTTKNNFTRWTQEIYVPVRDGDDVTDTIEKDGQNYKLLMDYDMFTTSNSIVDVTYPTLQGYSYATSEELSKGTGFDYEWTDSSGSTNNKHINEPWKTAKFFYSRNNYTLILRNGNERRATLEVPFESPLGDTVKASEEGITYYDKDLSSYYTFGGWFTSPDFIESTKFVYESSKMPAGGLVLYAKWLPVEYNVTFYNDMDAYNIADELSSVTVERGDTVTTSDIPSTRNGKLKRPTSVSRFSGWYYIDGSGNTVRFDPSTMPVTSELKLYAGWESDVVSSYVIKYVKKDTGEEVAEPTNGKAFVSSTKTFGAKGGSDLNEKNWWPTVPSHSILMKESDAENTFTFVYINKPSVWYRVRYVDMSTNEEFADPPSADRQAFEGVVTEKAPHISGYAVDKVTKSLVLAASDNTDSDAAKNEEISMNVITFYYTKNASQKIFEVNHYAQNIDGTYRLWQGQTFSVDESTIDMESVYSTTLLSSGYSVNNARTEYKGVVDVNPTGDGYVVIDIYYDRKFYPYVVKYIDADSGDIIKQFDFPVDPLQSGDSLEKHILGNTVEWNAPDEFRKDGVIYDRISSADMSLDIRVEEDGSGNVVDMDKIKTNVLNIYYRERSTFTVKYAAVCIPKDSTYSDEILKDVKISKTQEVVSASRDITGAEVLAYPTDKCKFLGWFDNPSGTGKAVSGSPEIKNSDIGDIDNDSIYYAVFRPNGEMATIRIKKYIDSLYYDSNDNPHGFKDGGVADPKNDSDAHGYLNLTKAEQNFVFKIDKYEKAVDGSKGDLVGTSYMLIDFGADTEKQSETAEKDGTVYRYMKSKDIRVEPGYIYML